MKNGDDKVAIRNAILTNTGIKILFGGFDPDDAKLFARVLFTGRHNLTQWKQGSERPIAVGQDRTTIANWSRTEMEARSEMTSHTRSHSRGTAYGTSTTQGTASGTAIGSGDSVGQVLTPPFHLFGSNAPNATLIPTPLSQSRGSSTSESSFEQSSQSTSESFTEIETESEADTVAHGTSRGTSRAEGGSEVFITRYEWLPSAMYSLSEQEDIATGELMNLAPREVFVKIRGNRPFRTRTADLPPAFKSDEFKQIMLPRYLALAAARSPYIRPADEVDAEIASRFASPLPNPNDDTIENEPWREPFDYPDPPPFKPHLRIVKPNNEDR